MYRVIIASSTAGLTVKQAIGRMMAKAAENRIEDLRAINAPDVVISMQERQLERIRNGDFKVDGLARKFKVADEEVLEVWQANTTGQYFREGRKPTVIMKLVTAKGDFYFDYHGCKISSTMTYLDAQAPENQFRRVDNI